MRAKQSELFSQAHERDTPKPSALDEYESSQPKRGEGLGAWMARRDAEEQQEMNANRSIWKDGMPDWSRAEVWAIMHWITDEMEATTETEHELRGSAFRTVEEAEEVARNDPRPEQAEGLRRGQSYVFLCSTFRHWLRRWWMHLPDHIVENPPVE
jgi:hypothetical protein